MPCLRTLRHSCDALLLHVLVSPRLLDSSKHLSTAHLAVPLGRLRGDEQRAEEGAQPREGLPAERRLQQLGALRLEEESRARVG